MALCPNCGCETTENMNFCPKCGEPVEIGDATPIEELKTVAQELDKAFEKPKKASKAIKTIISIVSVILSLTVGVGGVLYAYVTKQQRKNYVLYYKGEKATLGSSRFESLELGGETNAYSLVTYSDDYKKLFFGADRTDMGIYDLCYIDLGKADKKHLIEKGVGSYQISKNGKSVAYVKEHVLYKSNLKKSQKIMKDISMYSISKNGKKIVFITGLRDLYITKGDENKKIASGVSEFVLNPEGNYSEVYYIKDGNLWQYNGKENKKISKNVSNVIKEYKKGKLYYTKPNDDTVTFSRYIDDDMKEEDGRFVMPKEPIKADYTAEGGDKQYLKDYNRYLKAQEFAKAKAVRDQIREKAKNTVIDAEMEQLYYYDGSKEIQLTDSFSGYIQIANKPALTFSAYNGGANDRIKISEIENPQMIDTLMKETFFGELKKYVALQDNITLIDGEKPQITDDCKKLYYISDRVLYCSEISGKRVGNIKYYESDVDGYDVCGDFVVTDKKYLPAGEEYVYSFEVRVNGTKVADDSLGVWADKKAVYVLENAESYDSIDSYESGSGSRLIRYKKNRTEVIAEDVDDVITAQNGSVYYIAGDKGDVFAYKEKGSEKIDSGAEAFILYVDYIDHNIMNSYE